MSSDKVKPRELTGPGIRLILSSVAGGCVAVILALPQAVLPTSGPALRFEADAVSESRRATAAAAVDVPRGDDVDELWRLYNAQGLAETGEGESEDEFNARATEIRRVVATIRETDGDEAIGALRAHAAHGLDAGLRGDRNDEGAFLGTFPRMLERYGAMQNGLRVAPDMVLRALFAARFNGIMGLELTEGFSEVERQAYWGWLALGAAEVPDERRAAGLRGFAEAGGLDADEALGWLAYEAGDYAGAARFYARGGDEGNTRLRNHALACQQMME